MLWIFLLTPLAGTLNGFAWSLAEQTARAQRGFLEARARLA